jgi:hypothetical protein
MTAAHNASTVIASVPTILGYFPHQSLVVMTFRRGHLGATTAIDLPQHDDHTLAHLTDWATSVRAEAAVALIVDAHAGGAAPLATHRALAQTLNHTLALKDVHLLATHVVPEITAGVRWVCGDGCGADAVVDDPTTTPVAIVGVVTGRRVYASRTELHATVEILDAARTAALADVIQTNSAAAAAAAGGDECDDHTARQAVDHALSVAKRVSRGGELRDADYVDLARALANARVRDMLLGLAVTSKAPRAEVLWTVLSRSLPNPWRAEALVALAFFAFVRGDQPLAGVAVAAALQSNPAHRMADMLDVALRTGLRPKRIWELAEFAYGVAQLAGVRMPRRIVHTRRSA